MALVSVRTGLYPSGVSGPSHASGNCERLIAVSVACIAEPGAVVGRSTVASAQNPPQEATASSRPCNFISAHGRPGPSPILAITAPTFTSTQTVSPDCPTQ